MQPSGRTLAEDLAALDAADTEYATRFVDRLLHAAHERGASDIHLLPSPAGLDVSWRLDGVLVPLGVFDAGRTSSIVARLKVLADLLTYRTDVPQEGRLRLAPGVEMRISTLPTLHGEKAVVRIFRSGSQFLRLDDLGLPADVRQDLGELLRCTSGAIIVCGPAGSGKTTTLYACLRELIALSSAGRSIVTLEDPIEVPIAGITQSQASGASGFDMAAGLRAIVRQDPEVIMVGEVRDRATAEVALQASLTGQLVLTSFHAATAAGAISRLLDMGIEPYVLQSGLLGILCQRLVRRICPACQGQAISTSEVSSSPTPPADAEDTNRSQPCPQCNGTGYQGRLLLAELLRPQTPELQEAIRHRRDAATLAQLARATGMIDLATRAQTAISAKATTPQEIHRLFGSQ